MTATVASDPSVVGGRRPVGNGVFVAVVGPSGAGKDTVIDYARERLSDRGGICFARRVVTRASAPELEDHDTLDATAFADAVGRGAFAVYWEAHGLSYGLASTIDDEIGRGGVVVANVSRAVLLALKAAYAHLSVVQITAEPAVLAERLAARGRETPAEIERRLKRDMALPDGIDAALTIDNSGPLVMAGERFVAVLEQAAAFAATAGGR